MDDEWERIDGAPYGVDFCFGFMIGNHHMVPLAAIRYGTDWETVWCRVTANGHHEYWKRPHRQGDAVAFGMTVI